MRWTEEECSCNHGIINFRAIRFMINGSRIELDVTSAIIWWAGGIFS